MRGIKTIVLFEFAYKNDEIPRYKQFYPAKTIVSDFH